MAESDGAVARGHRRDITATRGHGGEAARGDDAGEDLGYSARLMYGSSIFSKKSVVNQGNKESLGKKNLNSK